MKKSIIIIFILALHITSILAQIPQGIKYQAVLRDNQGQIIANQNVSLRLSIIPEEISNESAYTEIQSIETNMHGIINLTIGNGVSSDDFSQIPWSSGSCFIKIEVDPLNGNEFIEMGITQLLTVPYSFYSQSADSAIHFAETDPLYQNSLAAEITENDTSLWNNKLDTEIDGDTLNEIQFLNLSNDTLFLSNSNYVVLQEQIAQIWQDNESTIYTTDKNIGIGTDTANFKLDVTGTIAIRENTNKLKLISNSEYNWLDIGNDSLFYIKSDALVNDSIKPISLKIEEDDVVFVDTNKNVGIGTNTPDAKLDVKGDIKISGGNPGTGKVLTSDELGNASWQNPANLVISPIVIANISSAGTLNSGTDNISVLFNSTYTRYTVSIDNEFYNSTDYIVQVQNLSNIAKSFIAEGFAGQLAITFYDESDNPIQADFNLIIYKP